MRMTEIVSYLDLSVYPSVALIFFLAAFIAIIIRVMTKTKAEIDTAANIPLNDDVIFTPRVSIESNEQADSNTDTCTDKGASHG